ncbi:type I DNA topoisomerase [Patescibacteria group bacterium]|nr:type I DNA topoisomerase [Patescibacteria group bacterium]
MSKNLVIVESPTKAKTISRFLGNDFKIESSYGHLRDLPKDEMGVDTKDNFKPTYVVSPKNEKNVAKLKQMAGKSDAIYFATDEDREGEAISWHLIQILKAPDKKVKRITFHEITKNAILEALKNPRTIDMNLVNAQQARRILDRLVGYELSPFLWKKIAKGLSAGRVQSVAVRLIVEREREIEKFKKQEYWSIKSFLTTVKSQSLEAELNEIDNKKIEQFIKMKLFAGDYTTKKTSVTNKKDAQKIVDELQEAEFRVANVTRKESKRNPNPPFTTAKLQQEAARRLGFSSKQTMVIAQQLYEGITLSSAGEVGLITYMRTDSLSLSKNFLAESRDYIKKELGDKYLPERSRVYKTKSKAAQEAHEAIRPTEAMRTPESIKKFLDSHQYKLYDLIWRRAVASQMASAIMDSTGIDIKAGGYLFRATGSTIKFDGYLKIYKTASEDKILPEVRVGETLDLKKIEPEQHFTTPPPQYTEASLIKALEEYDIGRPSTYASIMSTIQDRNYINKNEDKRFVPTDMGILVNDVLSEHFSDIVDIKFTAQMEGDLDKIANGEKQWVPILDEFYKPFHENLEKKYKQVDKKDLINEKTDAVCEKCGKPMVIKIGKFGKFLACTGYPKCRNTKNLDKNGEIAEQPQDETTGKVCDKCGQPMVIKSGKFGKFLACSGYPDCKNTEPIGGKIEVPCPECGGEIVQRRSKRGKIFYGCGSYPKCKFVLWSKPTGDKCPDCGSLLVAGAKDTVVCSNKECKHKKA